MIYKCQHFRIEELVPKVSTIGVENIDLLWMIFDPLALRTLDALRDRYGPATVNDWIFGGSLVTSFNSFQIVHTHLEYRGYRPPGCLEGARYSQHKFGRAFDVTFRHVEAEEVREDIRAHYYSMPQFHDIRRIEEDVSWLHFDTGNYSGKGIRFFKP